MSELKEISSNLHQWSEFSVEKQINFNGYYLINNRESVVIDPPDLLDIDLQSLKSLVKKNTASPLKAILLTNIHHDRMSRKIKEVFRVPVYIHENDSDGLDFQPDHTFLNGDKLFCGLKAIHLKNQKSPGETAFYLEDQKKNVCWGCFDRKIPRKVKYAPIRKV